MDDEQVQYDLQLMSLARGVESPTRLLMISACETGPRPPSAVPSRASVRRYDHAAGDHVRRWGTLAREQIQADDKEHVLNAVGTAATAMRAKLGESLSSIQKSNRPLEQATTPSLEALQTYTAGYTELSQGQFLRRFRRSNARSRWIRISPWRISCLPTSFKMLGTERREPKKKSQGVSLIDRVSEFERLGIAACYYQSTGELDKAIDAYRVAIGNYPRFWVFPNLLSENYIDTGSIRGRPEGRSGGDSVAAEC